MYADVDSSLYYQCQAAFPGQGQMQKTSEPIQNPVRFDGFNNMYSYTQSWICRNGPYTGWPQSLMLSHASVTVPAPFTGTICAAQAAPTAGIVVKLAANYSAVTLPATVTIPAGSLCATFNATSK